MRHVSELLSAIQQERQLISSVDQIWRLTQAPPSEEAYDEIGGLQLETVEADAEPLDERGQLVIVEMVGVAQLRIFVRGRTQN
jgi:hypothetical protein